MIWLSTQAEETAAIQELEGLPDRALAIVAVALLDTRLESTLRMHLRDGVRKGHGTLHQQMFRPSGPLGTLSAKISLGCMLGLYEIEALRDMEILKEVRNKFAHELTVSSFNEVRDLCSASQRGQEGNQLRRRDDCVHFDLERPLIYEVNHRQPVLWLRARYRSVWR